MYKVKFFSMILGMILNSQNYTGVILCMCILFLFYESAFPYICLCDLEKNPEYFNEKTALLPIRQHS